MRRALDAFWYIWDVMDRLNLSLIAAGVGPATGKGRGMDLGRTTGISGQGPRCG